MTSSVSWNIGHTWNYCTSLEALNYGTGCNYYGYTMKSGGISRFKGHLFGNDLTKIVIHV